nr:MAG: hypothetical protein [Bacteriophage sp.]
MKNFKDMYFSIWQEAWAIHKRFFGIAEDDTPAWEQLFQAVEAFGKKYAVTPEKQFAQNLVLLVSNEIEQKAKGGKEDAEKK